MSIAILITPFLVPFGMHKLNSMQVGFCQQRPDAAATRAAAALLRRLGAAADPLPAAELQPALRALVALLLQPCREPDSVAPHPHSVPAPPVLAGDGAFASGPARGGPVGSGQGSGLAPGLPESGWYGAAEEAVAALYALHAHPARLAAAVLERLAAAAFSRSGKPTRVVF